MEPTHRYTWVYGTETTTAATSGQVPMIARRLCDRRIKRRGRTHGGGEVGGDDLAGQRKPVRPPLADPLPPGRGERPAIGGDRAPRLARDPGRWLARYE